MSLLFIEGPSTKTEFLSCGVNVLKGNSPNTSTNYNQTQCYKEKKGIMGQTKHMSLKWV